MTTPDYYQFPAGLQPLHLSRHLTSNAGQAVQYLARSSRLDGVSKGQDESDLRKALNFIRDEIDRRFGTTPADGATEDELAALPTGSIILHSGEPWQRQPDNRIHPHGCFEGLQEYRGASELVGATILHITALHA